jgi:hypothetical protein
LWANLLTHLGQGGLHTEQTGIVHELGLAVDKDLLLNVRHGD